MSKKSPSYPWYARDFMADRHVIAMGLEAEACYRRLLDYQWLNGPVPADIPGIAAICKNVSPRKMAKLWQSIAPCFVPCETGAGLINRRLERVRAEMADLREKKATAGRRSGEARANRPRTGVEQNGNTSRTESEPATATATASAFSLPTTTTAAVSEFLDRVPEKQRPTWLRVVDGWRHGMGYPRGRAPSEDDIAAGLTEYLAATAVPDFTPRHVVRFVENAERRRTTDAPAPLRRDGWFEELDRIANGAKVAHDPETPDAL